MSLQLVKHQLNEFLCCEEARVICLKGRWGVGKTYVWENAFKESYENKSIRYNLYSYVSLFGLDNINDVKTAIFESTLTREDFLDNPNINTFEKSIQQTTNRSKKLKYFFKLIESISGRKGVIDSLTHMGFMNINQQIICLDDFERAGKNLKPLELLGLISLLKTSHNCKTIIIINDAELHNEKGEDFFRHLEKVCDNVITLEPTPSEAFGIALNESSPLYTLICNECLKLGITNIRIIKKILQTSEIVINIVNTTINEIKEHCINTVALGVCAVYIPSEFPPIDFIKNYQSLDWYISGEDEKSKIDAQKNAWSKLLDNYGYIDTDDLDKEIFDGIVRGFFYEHEILRARDELEKELAIRSKDNSLQKAWDQFRNGSLLLDDEIILGDILAATKENMQILTVNHLNSSVRIIREFGEKNAADSLISEFIEFNKEKPLDFWDINTHMISGTSDIDLNLGIAFNNELLKFKSRRSKNDIINAVASGKPSRDDYFFLSTLSPDEMKELILSIDDHLLVNFLEEISKFHLKEDPRAKMAHSLAHEALVDIAKKSPLRARRLQKYNIYLE